MSAKSVLQEVDRIAEGEGVFDEKVSRMKDALLHFCKKSIAECEFDNPFEGGTNLFETAGHDLFEMELERHKYKEGKKETEVEFKAMLLSK